MRIAVYTNAYKPIISGVVNTVSLLRQGFLARGHEVMILAPDYYGYRDQEDGVGRFPAVDLTRKVRFPVAIPWSPRLARLVRDFRPEIIHTHHPFVLGPLAMGMARHLDVPLVYTFHTRYEEYAHYVPLPAGLVKRAARRRIRKFVEAADVVTTPAESIRGLLQEYGITREILVLPNPVDLSHFTRAEGECVRRQLGLAPGELVAISIGRLGIEKNLGFMLEAFALMLRLAPGLPLRLVLVGAGPEEARLKELGEEMGLGPRLVLAGSVPHQSVPSYLAAADLFFLTSLTEVKPLVLLEAMAAGLPVVAVRAPGVVDTLVHGRHGLITEPEHQAFAQAAIELFRDGDRRAAMGCAAREAVESYSLERVADGFLALYEEAAARRRMVRG